MTTEEEVLQQIHRAIRHEDEKHTDPQQEDTGVYHLEKYRTRIAALVALPVTRCEVEVRLGQFTSRGAFVPGVAPAVSDHVQSQLRRRCADVRGTVSRSLVETRRGSNVRKIADLDDLDAAVTYQRKEKQPQETLNVRALGIRVGVAAESPATANDFDENLSVQTVRERTRVSYSPGAGNAWHGLRFDFTSVGRPPPCGRVTHEIEIERVRQAVTAAALIEATAALYRWSQEPPHEQDVATPENSSARAVMQFNNLFQEPTPEPVRLYSNFRNNPCSIKYRHLLDAKDGQWQATVKLDGMRTFLLVTANGSFLCRPSPDWLEKIGLGSRRLEGTLLDGELLGGSARAFHAFDLLFYRGRDYRQLSFRDRKTLLDTKGFVDDVRYSTSGSSRLLVFVFFF